MTSTLGIKKIQYPNGTNIATLDSSGSIAFAGASTVAGTLAVTGETTLATHLNLGDNDKIKLGASGDLEVYHDGSNSYIDDTGTGNLRIRANDQVKIQKYTGENMFVGIADGAASMYYDNSQKIATTSTGVTITGNIANASGDFALVIAGDIVLNADGGDWIFKDAGTEVARFINTSEHFHIRSSVSDKDIIFQGNDGGSAGTEIMRIDVSERRLGLGTDSPTEKLSIVNGSGDVGIRIQGNTRSFKMEQNNYGLRVFDLDASAERLRVDASGYVTKPNQARIMFQGNSNGNTNVGNGEIFGSTNDGNPAFSTGKSFVQAVGITYDSATGRFTVPVAGRYIIHFQAYYNAGAASCRIGTYINTVQVNLAHNSSIVGTMHVSFVANMGANDYIDFRQNSGGTQAWYMGENHMLGYIVLIN